MNRSHDVSLHISGRRLLVFAFVLAVVAPIIHPLGEQQASRFAFTSAIWDQGTLSVGDYEQILGRDRAVVDGATFSDKAPGQPLLVVPFYAFYRLLGGEAMTQLGLWWLTLWSSAIPAAVLAVLMMRWVSHVEPRHAVSASLATIFGTLLVVYSSLLFGHLLAALAVFAMFLMVRSRHLGERGLFAAGAVGSAAVLIEFPVALAIAVLTAAAFFIHRWKGWLVIAGGIPGALLLGLYNRLVFGDWFRFSYQWSAFSGPKEDPGGVLDTFVTPSLDQVAAVLISERGLMVAAPLVVVALAGLILMWSGGWRIDAAVIALVFVVMLSIQIFWPNPYAGGAGPRYVTPAMPFLSAPLAVAWVRWRRTTSALVAVSVLTMVAATFTNPQLASEFPAGLGYWIAELLAGRVAPTVFTEAFDAIGWVFHGVLVAAIAMMLVRNRRRLETVGETN